MFKNAFYICYWGWLCVRTIRYDFFIVSQAVRMGSVAPTHYNVVFDDSSLKPDHMQRLTYKLCHMYYNWQVKVRTSLKARFMSSFLLTFICNNVLRCLGNR